VGGRAGAGLAAADALVNTETTAFDKSTGARGAGAGPFANAFGALSFSVSVSSASRSSFARSHTSSHSLVVPSVLCACTDTACEVLTTTSAQRGGRVCLLFGSSKTGDHATHRAVTSGREPRLNRGLQ
jgi:hypothetical protein